MLIKAGDIVKLKAGGPPVNVRAVKGDHVWCTWFSLTGKLESEVFPAHELEVLYDDLPEPRRVPPVPG